jgi:hypothetical protein
MVQSIDYGHVNIIVCMITLRTKIYYSLRPKINDLFNHLYVYQCLTTIVNIFSFLLLRIVKVLYFEITHRWQTTIFPHNISQLIAQEKLDTAVCVFINFLTIFNNSLFIHFVQCLFLPFWKNLALVVWFIICQWIWFFRKRLVLIFGYNTCLSMSSRITRRFSKKTSIELHDLQEKYKLLVSKLEEKENHIQLQEEVC